MSVIGSNILAGASGQGGSYQISRSVRLRSSATAYFSRTAGTPTNQNRWTWSGWVKRGAFSGTTLFSGGSTVNDYQWYGFISDQIYCIHVIGGSNQSDSGSVTTARYRDPSAWYHFVIVYDSANATAANRYIVYVNGVQQAVSLYPSLNETSYVNASGYTQYIGQRGYSSTTFDGYLTEVNFIDGQALTPSSFGETNAVTGVWQPKKYTGTYGTNGFYLNFSDNSGATATTIGKDYSGNGNNWTPNNISVTAGVTYDSMTDVPTLTSATAANYCVLNSAGVGVGTIADANLKLTATASAYQSRATTIGVTSGKWYWEVAIVSGGNYQLLGIDSPSRSYVSGGYVGDATSGRGWSNAANTYVGGSPTSYGATYTTNDVLGFALDMDAGTLVCYKNGVSQGTAFSGITGEQAPAFSVYTSGVSIAPNFGQRPFAYTPPTGFVALNTQNLPAPTISNGANYMAATLYTGTDGVAGSVTGVGFSPDFVWVKSRSGANSHGLFDTVRGVQKGLFSNLTNAETSSSTYLTSFNSDGFSHGGAGLIANGSLVSWNWKAGGTAVSNTAGTITSSVSANPTAGFSVVTYTGTGANATVGHGLGVAPQMVIVKARSFAYDWGVYHKSIGAGNALFLNLTNASTAGSVWNSTAPTSSVFSVGAGSFVNTVGINYVAYCFSEVAGYSKFGSYTGNGSADGPFVYCGFRPRWVMIKRTDAAADWIMFDTSRNTYNLTNLELNANLSGAEFDTAAFRPIDILSNGFKLRGSNGGGNASGGTYIYACFAEVPFKSALGR